MTVHFHKQRGVVLVISLIMLLLITIIAVTASSVGVLELRMAAHEEQRAEAFQVAQAALDEISDEKDYFPIRDDVQPISLIACDSGNTDSDCSGIDTVVFNSELFSGGGAGKNATGKVYRISPESGVPPRLRGLECEVESCVPAYFQVEVENRPQGTSDNEAYVHLTQGQFRLVPRDRDSE